MGPHIEEAKSTIKLIVDSISSKMQTTHLILRFGVVAYRDHVKGEKYLTKINKFTDNQKTLEFVEQLDAEGGGDYPEAVLDGLE